MSKYRVKVGEEIFQVIVDDPTAHPVVATIGDQEFQVWIQEEEGPVVNGFQSTMPTLQQPPKDNGALPQPVTQTPDPHAVAAQPRRMEHGGKAVRAPMPGNIIQVKVETGDQVARGELLCVLEAMKMNNQIRAPHDGIIGDVLVTPGVQVNYGDPLVVFE